MTLEIDNWTGEIHAGDAVEVMNQMPEKSVHSVIFSPPYWGLRDYGDETENIWGGDENCDHSWGEVSGIRDSWGNPETLDDKKEGTSKGSYDQVSALEKTSNFCSKCGAWRGQFGLEPSPHMYVDHMVEVGRAVNRVLRDDGTWWLNLGDTYAGGGGISGVPEDWDSASTTNREKYPDSVPARDTEFEDKTKLLMPHRVAISLIDDGWICRNDAVWAKPNPMPESVTDRLSTTFEYFFLFSKQKNYHFDLDSIREPHKNDRPSESRESYAEDSSEKQPGNVNHSRGRDDAMYPHPSGKNPGDIFEVTVKPFSEAHFATFPPELIETPIKASCPWKVCSRCGTPYERERNVVDREVAGGVSRVPKDERGYDDRQGRSQNDREGLTQPTNVEIGDWEKQCDCGTDETEPGVVLDPFMGSGTTAVVAENLQRRWVGIDLNPSYVEMSEDRILTETDFNVNPISEW